MSPALSIFCYIAVGTVVLSGGLFLAASIALRRRDEVRRRLELENLALRLSLRTSQAVARRQETDLLEAHVRIVALEAQSFLDRQPKPN